MENAVTINLENEIAVIRLDRGARANAMSFEIMAALTQAAQSLEDEINLAAVVLTGTDKVFSAGMDLRDETFDRLDDMSLSEKRALAEHGPRLARTWAGLETPTVAAIDGACLAGGLALAAMCDFRVAGANALFGAPEVQVAHNMGWHSVPRLVNLVGVQPTRRLLLLGEQWDARTAMALGFVDAACDAGRTFDKAMDLARTLQANPRMAARMVKRQIDAAAHGDEWALSAYDKDQQIVAWMSEEFSEVRRRFSKK